MKRSKEKVKVLVSLGTCGIAAGTNEIKDTIIEYTKAHHMGKEVEVIDTGCMGLCHSEPTIEVIGEEGSVIYGDVIPRQIPAILKSKSVPVPGLKVIEKSWYIPEEEEQPKGVLQARIALRNSGRIDPGSIKAYIETQGYEALKKVYSSMSPEEVIEEVKSSGLRGRGGGGFPAGVKWGFAAAQKSKDKYVICNADEGDPGAFMDRAILEGDPHAVLEAMAIVGYAIGAENGVIYIRAEYPLAIKRLKVAIEQARKNKFLGKNLFKSKKSFDIEIKYGAGAFVCGEETALIHSIEGMRGEPTFKPPFPAVQGLWDKPTIVNNVETLANVAAIIRKGSKWFKSIGTEGSAGTKVFALAGKIKKVGLIEVPMGTRLKDIIYKLGEGIHNDREFKAVQTGGPSGGCITKEHLDIEIDYESLKKLGSMMGSGGMIVMDEDDCMVNIAKFFLDFTLDESCGKCTPCRIGNKRLHEMLDEICQGKGTMKTLDRLKELSVIIKDTSLCGLGQSSPNPVLSTLRNFENEYIAHVTDHRCDAKVCRDLLTIQINDKCIGCTLCARNCPVHCISGERKELHVIDQDECIKCGVCIDACKFHAIEKV